MPSVAVLAVFAPGVLVFTLLVPVMLSHTLGAYLFYAQHNFPGTRFLDRGNWDYVAAALQSSSYLRLNPVLHWFTANIGYHHVHHLNAHIPFYRLPEAMAGIEELQSPETTSLHPRDIYRCLRLKLWDPERNCLVTFREWKGDSPRGNKARCRDQTEERHVGPPMASRTCSIKTVEKDNANGTTTAATPGPGSAQT